MAKIPWSRIQEAFEGEWVELTEHSWMDTTPYPLAAKIRHHSASRSELLKQISRSRPIEGAVVMYIGSELPSVICPSLSNHAPAW